MSDKELEHKILKSKRYADQIGIFRLCNIKVEMKSNHGKRFICFDENDNNWKCTCDFFQERGTCSHIMALQRKLGKDLCGKADSDIEEKPYDT